MPDGSANVALTLDAAQVRAFADRPLDLEYHLADDGAKVRVGGVRVGGVTSDGAGGNGDGERARLSTRVVTLAHFVKCMKLERVDDEAAPRGGESPGASGELARASRIVERPQPILPYNEDVKCIDTTPILEGKLHADLPFKERVEKLGYFRKGSARSFNAREMVKRLREDLYDSAQVLVMPP